MTVTSVDKDTENLTMTVTTDLAASVDRVWQMWEDPRRLEKWWGPPTYPATFERHEFTEGGVVTYHMTGPEGEKYPGRWNVRNVGKPTLLEFEDAFADDDGNVNPDMPVSRSRSNSTRPPSACAGAIRRTTGIFCSIADTRR